MISKELQDEAKAFDLRILERVSNGLVPDLRNSVPVDWFYNNPWRRPEYVDMIFGDYLRFALSHIGAAPLSILETGSGLGHMTLELARHGHQVTGLELSGESVRIATEYAATVPKPVGFGSLTYVNDDLMTWNPSGKFDVVCFFLTLHHFEFPETVIARISSLLKPGGKLIVVEPARDLFSPRNAALVALIRNLLTINGNWYQSAPLPESQTQLETQAADVLNEYREAKEKDEPEQSPNDNASYSSTMLDAVSKYFETIVLTHGNSISPRLLGGVRGKTETETQKIASFIKLFDEFATTRGLIDPGVIYYAGKKSANHE